MGELGPSDPRTVAAKALARLEQEPRTLLQLAATLLLWYRPRHARAVKDQSPDGPYRSAHGGPNGDALAERAISLPRIVEQADALGLRYLGQYEFGGLVSFMQRDAWVSSDGFVRVSGLRAKATSVEGTMAPFVLSTMFDDGAAIVSWGERTEVITSSPRVKSRAGTGALTADMASHRSRRRGVPARARP